MHPEGTLELAVTSSFTREINTFFALPRRKTREVMPMYLTLDHLLLIGSLIISVLNYIDNHNKKR
jgi:hypothetical protein